MKDRLSLYPGRVKLVPVAGQENVYDMTRADQPTQEGDPLNKATLLKDATAALFGLGPDSVPDDAFAWIGKYNLHWWRRRTEAQRSIVEKPVENFKLFFDGSSPQSCFYGRSVSYDESDVVLVNVNSYYRSFDDFDEGLYKVFRGTYTSKYLSQKQSTEAYFIDQNATFQKIDSDFSLLISSGKKITSEVLAGDWEYLQSSDRSAYPDSGTQGGYEYQYLGIPFENAATAPKIATGSYVGTGTYGQSNPNSLTFGFEPKTVIVQMGTKKGYATWAIFLYGGVSPISHTARQVMQNIEKNNLSWYTTATSNEADYQLNSSGVTYNYIALG